MTLRVHAQMESSQVNGPGRRAVIWVQGCSLGCTGCFNKRSHSTAGGREVKIPVLVDWLKSLWLAGAISGLTISGGEPMEQAAELSTFLEAVCSGLPSLSIGLFSGYAESELVQGQFRADSSLSRAERGDLWQRIRRHLDFAVLGRYNRLQPSDRPLATSRNQQLLLLSDRHPEGDFTAQSVEITIGAEGMTQITGFPVLQ